MKASKRVVAVYCRVSSDEQRDRETIKTQQETLGRWLRGQDGLTVFRWYQDDGVSGTIPMEQRPEGKHLVADSIARRFNELVFTRGSRLSRDEIEAMKLFALFDGLGITLTGVSEPVGDRTMFGFSAVMHAAARRQFLADSAKGMERAAKEGRYTGGIVAFGFRVEGAKEKAHLVPDEDHFWGEVSAAEIVRRIYAWLAEGRSCYWVADYLNDLGVPTHYVRDGRKLKDARGNRTRSTQGVWRPGRIANLVKNPVYKGMLSYGRRTAKEREVIVAAVPAIVSEDVWGAAQRSLAANRILRRKPDRRVNVLRSVVECGTCALKYSGVAGRDDVVWLRCGGQVGHRGKIVGRCPGKSIKLSDLGPVVLRDIEGFLRNPGDVIDELTSEREDTSAAAMQEAERIALESALASIPQQRKAILGRLRNGRITEDECDEELDEIARLEEQQRRKLAELTPVDAPDDLPDEDLLAEIRSRLDEGLDDVLWQEIVQHLVRRIVIHTEVLGEKKKRARIVVEYRVPGVAVTDTGIRAGQNYTKLQRVVQL